jgi:hypothetical protein
MKAASSRYINRMMSALLVCALVFSLSGCMVINTVSTIDEKDWLSPSPERAVVVFGIGNEGKPSSYLNIILKKYILGKRELTTSCFFTHYDLIQAGLYPSATGDKKYFVFDVLPGYYVYNKDEIIFKVDAGKINYLGDFIRTDKKEACPEWGCEDGVGTYTICMQDDYPLGSDCKKQRYVMELRQDINAATAAVKKFRSLKPVLIPAEQVKIEGQSAPIPFCTM